MTPSPLRPSPIRAERSASVVEVGRGDGMRENGARGGRTLTVSPPTDFKSVASADSAIAPASFALILPYFEMLSSREALSLFI